MLNSRDLADLRADVRANVETLLELCREQGLNVLITQTKRDNEYQAYLYEQGRSRPGSIVTNSRTTTFHGAGLAIDFCENRKGHEYDDPAFFRNVAIIAKGLGFSWGGDWKTFVDYPHLQWDDHGKYTTAMLRAGKTCPQMPDWEEEHMDIDKLIMDIDKLIDEMTPEQAYKIRAKADLHAKTLPLPTSWDAAGELGEAKALGITDGSNPMIPTPRYQTAIMVKRAVKAVLKTLKG